MAMASGHGYVLVARGEGIVGGKAQGPVRMCAEAVSVARIDTSDGTMREPGRLLDGCSLAAYVRVCTSGNGSSGGSYRLLELATRGLAPIALVLGEGDAVLVAGAVLAEIPLVAGIGSGERAEI